MAILSDPWRLAIGMFTAIPVPPPSQVDRRIAGASLLRAPLAVLPLGVLVAVIGWLGIKAELAPLAVAAIAVGALAASSRVIHLDGLADTADGLTASYDRQRSLDIMKKGDTGPAGTAAIVIVLVAQIAALSAVFCLENGPWIAAVMVCISRAAPLIGCCRGVRSARPTGLGKTHAESVSPIALVIVWGLALALLGWTFTLIGWPWWRGVLAGLGAIAVTAWLVRRSVTRLGGIVGDILGASIEMSLAVLLLVAS